MSRGRTHMSLLSNQQGRPASVRARPPSRSPKGSHSLARPFWLPAAIQASGRRRVACSRCEALWCWGRRAQRRRLRLRARRFPARRSATPASFQILRLCESAEAREYFPTCAHKYFKNATRLAAIRAISIPLRAGI